MIPPFRAICSTYTSTSFCCFSQYIIFHSFGDAEHHIKYAIVFMSDVWNILKLLEGGEIWFSMLLCIQKKDISTAAVVADAV